MATQHFIGAVTGHDDWLSAESAAFKARTAKSQAMHARAQAVMPSGVATCYHTATNPFFLDPSRCIGATATDLDSNQYIDFHGGYGVTALGHRHPELIARWNEIISDSACIVGVASPDACVLAEKLVDRFQMPFWRFMNSGTEATLDSIRLARAHGGPERKYIVKVEASYHGHHDAVWVSVAPPIEPDRGTKIPSVPLCQGIPADVVELTRVVEFNNHESLRAVMAEYRGRIGGIILEPVMFNSGCIPAEAAWMAELFELARADRVSVIFDLVKMGVQMSAARHLAAYPAPDMVTLAKALGGGHPIGAVGMSADYRDLVERGDCVLAGTCNGGSYAMRVASAVLDILSPDVLERMEALSSELADALRAVAAEHGFPALVVNKGNKGALFLQKALPVVPVRHYRDQCAHADRTLEQTMPIFFMNRGVWIQVKDEWTMSAQHTREHVAEFVRVFREFVEVWKAGQAA